MSKIAEQHPAFLTILAGGTGREAGRYIHDLHDADGRPFTTLLVQMDTDPVTAPYTDRAILFPLEGDMVATLRADPETYGDVPRQIVRSYPQLLNPEDMRNGAR